LRDARLLLVEAEQLFEQAQFEAQDADADANTQLERSERIQGHERLDCP
jgi:hypothetical protein